MLRMLRKKAKGFTLIELLIVVAIIGILAAIAIPNLLAARARSNNSRASTDSKQIVTQMSLYVNDNNCLPTKCTPVIAVPEGLWDKTAIGNTVYMAATYDPWNPGGIGNFGAVDQVGGATTALTSELRAWSKGATGAGDFGAVACPALGAIGYSSMTGSCPPQ